MIEKRDLAGRTVIANASSRDPLGYVVRSGSNGPGEPWRFDGDIDDRFAAAELTLARHHIAGKT